MIGRPLKILLIMLSTIEILLPIFGLIFAGYLCRQHGIFGPAAASELNRLVVWLALPSLLFDIMAHATWQKLDHPGFAAAFGLGAAMVFVGVLAVTMLKGQNLTDASIEAIAVSYPNTAYIGFPLGMLLYGDASLVPSTIATIIVVCVLFAIAIILIEISLLKERRPHVILMKIGGKLLQNPLIIAPMAGVVVSATHLTVPNSLENLFKLAGTAASPCALICLGVFLGEKQSSHLNQLRPWALTLVKLLVQPALTWWLAACVFGLANHMVYIAVLLSALPTGTGPFMLAEFYKREPMVTSRTILLSTSLSIITLSLLITYLT